MYNILTIAGSDSSAGAGIQADMKTISALGSYALTVITIVTAQNTQGVQSIYPMSVEAVISQLDSVFSDIDVHSVKLGALYDDKIIESVSERLKHYSVQNIVCDPVMFSKNSSALLKEESLYSMKNNLIPLCKIITPNISEAEILSGVKILNTDDMESAGRIILNLGCKSVLVKGGHLDIGGKSIDCLIFRDRENEINIEYFESHRINTINTHGTGCTLSSAIATFLGQGLGLKESILRAKRYITFAIESAKNQKLGKGIGPVNHFFDVLKNSSQELIK